MSDVGPWTRFGDPAPATTPTAPASGESGPWEKFAGTEAKVGKDAGLYSRFLSGFTSDAQEQIRMLADRLFPNESLDKSVQRFAVRKGKLVYRGDDGNVYEALPEGGMRGFLGDTLQGAGKAFPVVGGAAAGMATLPWAVTGPGLAGTMAASAAGAAAGDVARQKIGDVLLGRASTGTVNPLSVVREAAEGGVGQGIGVGMTSALTRGAVRDIAKYDPIKTRQAYDEAKRIGVDLTPAEATGLPTLAAQQKRLTNITATSDDMREFFQARDRQVLDAWGRFMDRISTAADAEDVGKLARETAGNVFKSMKDELQARATPLYRRAYIEGDAELWSPTLERLSSSPAVKDAMRQAVSAWRDNAIADGFGAMNPGAMAERGRLKFSSGSVPVFPNLQFWDYTKRALDGQVQAAIEAGQSDRARVLTKLVSQLRSEIDAIGPDVYKQARQVWGTGADNIETAMQSALKIIADSKDTTVLQAAQHAFNPVTRSPQMVAKLRTLIEKENPAAWQALKRLYIQDVTSSALRITETGDIANPAGKIFKAFSNPKVVANMMAAMDDTEREMFRDTLAVFRKAASVPALRSDTEFNRLMSEEAERAAQPALAKVVGGIKALNPANQNFLGLQSLQDFLTNRNLEKNATQVAALITSGDPEAIKAMKELRKLSLRTREGLVLLGHVLERGAVYAGTAVLAESDDSPGREAK